tara:strand:+ start:326 stop:1084 length:759 start_codon:yes stop_codon:yes gene_type:complete
MIKKSIKFIFFPILSLIKQLIIVFQNHALPIKKTDKLLSYDLFEKDEILDSYKHFKKYFYNSIFLKRDQLRNYSIKRSISNHEENDYYLEFGVFTGNSINNFSKFLKKINIYGFDSFEGLKEDWFGHVEGKEFMGGTHLYDLKKRIPKLNKNVIPVIGWAQDTLPKFIENNKNMKINFIHMDMDTYPSTKFVLEKLKPYMKNNCIIIFDEIYNFSGWKVGEYKALSEVFKENEYKFICFSMDGPQAVIEIIK